MKQLRPITITFACLLILTGSAWPGPRLTIEDSHFNFGYVPQNSKISHQFWLKSTGDDSLKILKVVPGCGCTKAPLEKKNLGIGDSTRLEIIFSTRKYRNRVSKRPRIETNAGTPHKTVEFTANVVARPDSTYPIIISPYKLDLSQFSEKIRDKISVTFTNVSDQELQVELIDIASDYFAIEMPRSIKAGESVEALLTLHDDALDKSFEKSLTLQLNDERNSRFTIPVKRIVRLYGADSK